MIDALVILEPGISNSITNVKFELSVAKIAQLKQQVSHEIISKADAEKLFISEKIILKNAFSILAAGSEGKILIKKRFDRIAAQI